MIDTPAAVGAAPAIVVRGLSREFAGRRVLRKLDLTIQAGETVVIFGPNGAGKTTLLRILATLLKPTSGSLHIAGINALENGADVRRQIGVLSHQTYLYDDLTAEENLRFYAGMYDVPNPQVRIDAVLREVELSDRRQDRVRIFSRGMQQRLALARALLHEPKVLLLDEPESGLDPTATANLGRLLAKVDQRERTVVLTSHDLMLGLDIADRVVILAKGQVVFDAPRAGLDRASLEAAYAAAI